MEKHFFASYTVQELQRLGYWDCAEARPTNLTIPIHPVLQRERCDCPDNLYNGIAHILRLASAMLQCPASIAFHVSLMFVEREHLPEPSQRHGYPCYRFRHTPHGVGAIRPYFNMIMARIAPHIRLRFYKQTDPGFTHLTAFAVTRRNPSLRTYANGPVQTGTGSDIFVNYVYIENLSKGNMSLSQQLRLQFYMALTISHEMAHAVNNAVSMQLYEPFYEDQRLSELGRAWETEVFGGMAEMIGETDARNPLAFAKWPTYNDKAAPTNGVRDLRGPKSNGSGTTLATLPNCGSPKRQWDRRRSSEGRWLGDSRGRVFREEIDEGWEENVEAPEDFFDLEAGWENLDM